MMAEMLELLQEVQVKMNRIQEIKAKFNMKEVKTNNVKCTCGCTVVFSSLKRHQKTKKHLDLLEKQTVQPVVIQEPVKEPVVIQEPVKEPVVIQEVKEPIDIYCKYENDMTDKLLKYTTEQFYKGLYVRNYKNQQYLESSLIHDIHEILDNKKKLPFKDMVKIWRQVMYKSLDEHLELYSFEDKATDQNTFIEHICKNVKKKNIPIMYSIKNITKFKTTLKDKLYNDFADMRNRESDSILIKDFVSTSIKTLLNEHISKFGFDEDGTNEYLTIMNEINDHSDDEDDN